MIGLIIIAQKKRVVNKCEELWEKKYIAKMNGCEKDMIINQEIIRPLSHQARTTFTNSQTTFTNSRTTFRFNEKFFVCE